MCAGKKIKELELAIKLDIKFWKNCRIKDCDWAGFYIDYNYTMRNDNFDLKMQNSKLKIIDTFRCFSPADSLENVIKFH